MEEILYNLEGRTSFKSKIKNPETTKDEFNIYKYKNFCTCQNILQANSKHKELGKIIFAIHDTKGYLS